MLAYVYTLFPTPRKLKCECHHEETLHKSAFATTHVWNDGHNYLSLTKKLSLGLMGSYPFLWEEQCRWRHESGKAVTDPSGDVCYQPTESGSQTKVQDTNGPHHLQEAKTGSRRLRSAPTVCSHCGVYLYSGKS